ncbi:F-box/WD repeat-containing protein 9-like isoform X1 [Vanessa tameamea]|uniref:F-box/WD repeat-containing protein 9-like isoform X1 n=2 Tax=Vanessa tameamea TaxID=334116 RepID=A0A8B8ILH7_VANTA
MCDVLQSVKEQLVDIENECISPCVKLDDMYNAAEPCLQNMPLEIILKICSYLDANFIKNNLSKVCQRFNDILDDISLWKYRASCKMRGCFPPLFNLDSWKEDDVDWTDMCIEMEAERNKWCNVDKTTKHLVIKDVHYASVDAVILVNKGQTCISGGRDRCLALWNVLDIQIDDNIDTVLTDLKPTKIRHDAHAGWVWDLATVDVDSANTVYSASWDNTVKAWDINCGFECIETFNCSMSALSVVAYGNNVMAGLYSKKILTFDIRCGPNPTNVYKPHRGPILALTTHKNQIASVSEDKTLAIFDSVAGKVLKTDIKMPSEKAYPVSLSWNTYAMYIGDSKGCLHLFDPNNHNCVRTHELWQEASITEPSNRIAGCHQGDGTLIACSDRGEIKFLYNSSPPTEYKSMQTSTVDVTQLQYLNGILAVGTCDSALEFWIPNEQLKYNNL